MAQIEFRNIKHAYPPPPGEQPVYALSEVNQVWEDGGAYALLGPSGCGKTTLLNVISGLLMPSQGTVLFDGQDVTQLPTAERQIAQVFQFPVVYDTMTVYDNLAFPLRNRGVSESRVDPQVQKIAAMLDLQESLNQRASGLTADGKQKISLGRGLVRSDVNVIMFDEPLTVIDPHLKWLLRSKLKELHQQIGVTMIYVTHDQTEALTFADKVVVMYQGTVVQVGTPVELFNQPLHTFVGNFIGSPGMNILPCDISDHTVSYKGNVIATQSQVNNKGLGKSSGKLEIGIRPEFIRFSDSGIPVTVDKVNDLGRYQVATVRHDNDTIKIIVDEDQSIPVGSAHIEFEEARTFVYQDSWMVEPKT